MIVNKSSQTIVLNYLAPPKITTQPASQSVCTNQPATFSVVVSGTRPLTYIWKKGTATIGTDSAYAIDAVTASDTGRYTVTIANPADTITSSTAVLSLKTTSSKPTILPASPTVDKTVLRLWVAAVITPGTIEVVPILTPWQESSITANLSPELGLPVASFDVGLEDAGHFVDVDVTELVQDWASGAMDNHGLALRGVESGAVNVVFDTKESVLTSHAPELEVALAGAGAPDQGAPVRWPGGAGRPGAARREGEAGARF
jgi:hypothetical protein